MFELIERLYPVCRSLTGDGVRTTLSTLQEVVPVEVHEVPTGTRVFDWEVPREWNIRDAYVKDEEGRRIVDFRDSCLHVVGYSVPVRTRLPLAELRHHLHSLPEQATWIPYRTSYYEEAWGFCIRHDLFESLSDGEYEVCIDASLDDGHLTYGELVLPGELEHEVLIHCHVCHPSLCNDNLSGIALATFLARELAGRKLRYSYRFLFLPGTIGAITWLALNEDRVERIKHGLVLAGVGDSGQPTYKRSRHGNAEIDRAMIHALEYSNGEYGVRDFVPYGYDERQYSTPGFNLPVGCFMRSPWGEYPEYHTSADDLSFVKREALADSFQKCLSAIEILEANRTWVNLSPKGEPRLGSRGLYRSLSGHSERREAELAMFWVLNLSDGSHSLLDIAERSGIPFPLIAETAERLRQHELLAEA